MPQTLKRVTTRLCRNLRRADRGPRHAAGRQFGQCEQGLVWGRPTGTARQQKPKDRTDAHSIIFSYELMREADGTVLQVSKNAINIT